MMAPLGMLLVTKASALISGKAFEGWDVVAGVAGIFGTITIYSVLVRLREKAAKGPALSGA
jgi:hypothetical protein